MFILSFPLPNDEYSLLNAFQDEKTTESAQKFAYLTSMYYLCTQMIAEAPCKDFVLRLPLRDAIRRDGRVVDYSSLENCRTERYRGFESLSLRKVASR